MLTESYFSRKTIRYAVRYVFFLSDFLFPIGMLSRLSTEHVMQLLDCLRSSYKLACDFDLRPGLKFLIQKVAHTEVAVNLYKQAGASMVFYIHTLIKICSNIPSLTLDSVRTLLSKENKKSQTGKEITYAVEESESSHNESSSGLTTVEVSESDHKEDESDMTTDGKTAVTDNAKADSDKDSGAINKQESSNSNIDEPNKHLKSETSAFTSQSLEAKTRTKDKTASYKGFKEGSKVIENPGLFVSQLRSVCDELCQSYIDILYDKEGTSCVDNMADQQLFFLIAQPDDFPDIPKKPDLSGLKGQLEQTQARLQGLTITQPINVQAVQGMYATIHYS